MKLLSVGSTDKIPYRKPEWGEPTVLIHNRTSAMYKWNAIKNRWDHTSGNSVVEETSPTAITFNDLVPFDKSYQHTETHAVSSDIEFAPSAVNRKAGAVTMIRLLADGVSNITFSSIREINTSAGYDNREDILNYLVFFYDGFRYFVNIFQEIGAVAADIVAPALQSAVISNSIRNKVVLTFNEALNTGSVPATSDFSISGKTISSVTVVGSTVNVFTSSDFAYGESVNISYIPGVNPIQDSSINDASTFSSAVTNDIAAPDSVAPLIQAAVVNNSTKDKILLSYDDDFNPAIVPATTDFTVSGGKTVTLVEIVDNTVTLTVNSDYAVGNVITVSYAPGTNKLQDFSGNFSAALSSQAVTNNIAASAQVVIWENLVNATDSGGFINYQATNSGGRGTVSIDPTIQFEVYAQFTSLCPATVMMLDKDAINAYVWGGTQVFEAGCYYYGAGANYAVNGTAFTEFDGAFPLPSFLKLRKSGNDIILSKSATENGTYTDVHTFTGALTGLSVLYIHVLFAANGPGDKIQVKYKIG